MGLVLLQNARIVDPANGLDMMGELLIAEGKIAAVGEKIPAEKAAGAEAINLKGKVVCPGLIDMHVHLREPGQCAKETIKTGTAAAARGDLPVWYVCPIRIRRLIIRARSLL